MSGEIWPPGLTMVHIGKLTSFICGGFCFVSLLFNTDYIALPDEIGTSVCVHAQH